MKYLKISLTLITILFLGGLFVCASVYADEPDRSDVRAAESSSPQRDEAAEEAWRAYEYRISQYEKILPQDRGSLEAYLKDKASAQVKTDSSAKGGHTAVTGSVTAPANLNQKSGPPDANAGASFAKPNEKPPVIAPPKTVSPSVTGGGSGGKVRASVDE